MVSRLQAGKREDEGAALAGDAFEQDLAAVQLYDHLDNGESQALPGSTAAFRTGHLVKTLEDALLVRRGDADAAISHPYLYPLLSCFLR